VLRLAIRREAELGEWWVEKAWVFGSGVGVAFEDASYSNRVPTIRRGLAEVEEVHILLNTARGRLHEEGWSG
jgi:hypothetical protein